MKKSNAIGLAIIVGFVALGASAFKSATTPYVSFEEARQSQSSVQVKGKLDQQSVRVNPQTHNLCFSLKNEKGSVLPVVYARSEPANFRQAPEVVAVGKFDGQTFQAENLLVKCPSKYQGEGNSHPANVPVTEGKSPSGR